MDVSVIIPTYNLFPYLLNTLYSLENQIIENRKMEVIIVDDGSTDKTPTVLESYHAPFPFKYIRLSKNSGVQKARNIGIEQAKGEILIFLDAENIVDPHFVENHYQQLMGKENLVLNGSMRSYGTFTVLHPKFNLRQLRRFYYQVQSQSHILEDLNLNSEYARNNIRKLRQWRQTHNEPISILSKEDISSQLYKQTSFKYPFKQFDQVIQTYGENFKGFQFPWISCITRNLSMRKKLINKVGYFDEKYSKGWGIEDWDVGYRLYKAGANFMYSDKIPCYHQEHPIQGNKQDLFVTNYLEFLKKYPEFDVFLMGYFVSRKMKLVQINKSYNDLKVVYNPEESESIIDYFYRMNQ